MIMKKRVISYLLIILLFESCSKEVIPEILNPQTSNLLSPANNENCLDIARSRYVLPTVSNPQLPTFSKK